MGRWLLPPEEFNEIFLKITNIEISQDAQRDKKLFEYYEEIERNLEYLGASAIEDKL